MGDNIESVCERHLHEPSGGSTITVRLGKPEQSGDTEYRCAFQLSGLGDSRIQYAFGVDAFQALQIALERIRVTLEDSNQSLTWQGGEPADAGFPRIVPVFFGLEFSRRIGRLIDEEVERFGRATRETSIGRP